MMPGYQIDTPEGIKPVLRVIHHTRPSRYTGLKFITQDNKVIETDSYQYFFLRSEDLIKSSRIKEGMWLKGKGTNYKIKKIIYVYDILRNYSVIVPSSFGGKFFLYNGILTAYRL